MLRDVRILVVEDNYLLADEMYDYLAGLGIVPIGPAATLEDAIALAREMSLDSAVLDINLDGRLCTAVCEVLARRDIPVLFHTGYRNLGLVPLQFRSMPVVDKPFEPEQLKKVLTNLFAGRTLGRSGSPRASNAADPTIQAPGRVPRAAGGW
jgi:DNA-binding response OmpR family regulator